jgi:hypothetical protein
MECSKCVYQLSEGPGTVCTCIFIYSLDIFGILTKQVKNCILEQAKNTLTYLENVIPMSSFKTGAFL